MDQYNETAALHGQQAAQYERERDTLRAILSALLSDIDALVYDAKPELFGPFSVYDENDPDGVVIEWPNLAITAAEAHRALGR